MARYNVQKRATLDRLTLTFQLRARAAYRNDLEGMIRDVHHALEAGRGSFTPNLSGLRAKIRTLFEEHEDRVIHVAVSDGIQEITPENRLGLWMEFPDHAPIEETLTVALAGKRDQISKRIRKKSTDRTKARTLADEQLDQYLENVRKVYRSLAHEWTDSDGSVDDVKDGLQRVLHLTDNQALRTFRTETTSYFNEARHEYFSQETAADYIELYAVTDGRISHICETRHGFVVTMDKAAQKKYMPAFHPHCRTIQRPLISLLTSHKSIIDRGLTMDESRFAPLPSGWA